MRSHSGCLHPIFCTVLLCTFLMITDCGLTTEGPGAVFVDPGCMTSITATRLFSAGKY